MDKNAMRTVFVLGVTFGIVCSYLFLFPSNTADTKSPAQKIEILLKEDPKLGQQNPGQDRTYNFNVTIPSGNNIKIDVKNMAADPITPTVVESSSIFDPLYDLIRLGCEHEELLGMFIYLVLIEQD